MKKSQPIRALRESDFEQILGLMESRGLNTEDAKKRAQLLFWLALNNPYAEPDEVTYFVYEKDGKILGYQGRMPLILILGGKKVKGFYGHDLYVHPSARTKGMGFLITMKLADTIEKESNSIVCHFGMTKLNFAMQKLRPSADIHKTYWYIKYVNPRRVITKLFKFKFLIYFFTFLTKCGLSVIDYFLVGPRSKTVDLKEVKKFHQGFDDFAEKILTKTANSTYKSSRYLNWKFCDRPYPLETVLSLEQNGLVKGFVVLAISPYSPKFRVGIIEDMMVDPDDVSTIRTLAKGAINHFKKQNIDSIECVMSDQRLIRHLKKMLFIQKVSVAMILLNLQKLPEPIEGLADMDNWHITKSESDSYMLSFNS